MFDGNCITTCGTKHKRCQDCSGVLNEQDYSVCVVADGHGSSDYTRSDMGSQIAVDATFEVISRFMNKIEFSKKWIDEITSDIVDTWTEKVNEHIEKNKLSFEEKNILRRKGHRESTFLYGTTLIVGVLSKSVAFGFRIGDGSLASIDETGLIDELSFLNNKEDTPETNSLCHEDAKTEFDSFIVENKPGIRKPLAICVCTDGIDNNYFGDSLKKFFYGSITKINKNWYAYTAPSIISLSKQGNKDDCSLSEIYDRNFDFNKLYKNIFNVDMPDCSESNTIDRIKMKIRWDGIENMIGSDATFVEKGRWGSIHDYTDGIIEYKVKKQFDEETNQLVIDVSNRALQIKQDNVTYKLQNPEFTSTYNLFKKEGYIDEYIDNVLIFRGKYENGQKHGPGALFFDDGTILFNGTFDHGIPIHNASSNSINSTVKTNSSVNCDIDSASVFQNTNEINKNNKNINYDIADNNLSDTSDEYIFSIIPNKDMFDEILTNTKTGKKQLLYHGDMKNEIRSGYGIEYAISRHETNDSRSIYTGHYSKGVRDGEGTLHINDKDTKVRYKNGILQTPLSIDDNKKGYVFSSNEDILENDFKIIDLPTFLNKNGNYVSRFVEIESHIYAIYHEDLIG